MTCPVCGSPSNGFTTVTVREFVCTLAYCVVCRDVWMEKLKSQSFEEWEATRRPS